MKEVYFRKDYKMFIDELSEFIRNRCPVSELPEGYNDNILSYHGYEVSQEQVIARIEAFGNMNGTLASAQFASYNDGCEVYVASYINEEGQLRMFNFDFLNSV